MGFPKMNALGIDYACMQVKKKYSKFLVHWELKLFVKKRKAFTSAFLSLVAVRTDVFKIFIPRGSSNWVIVSKWQINN